MLEFFSPPYRWPDKCRVIWILTDFDAKLSSYQRLKYHVVNVVATARLLINVQLYTETGRPFNIEGLLDSGADTVFIPKGIAEGLELPKLSEITSSGVLSTGKCYQTKIGLIVGRTKSRRVDFGIIDAVFPSTDGNIPLLIGRKPIFDYFQVTFEQYKDPPSFHLKQIDRS